MNLIICFIDFVSEFGPKSTLGATGSIDSAIFIDARDPEDYNIAHIKNSINIPYDYFEDYEDLINSLDESAVYIIYCSGGECSLSLDLADYLYNEKLFDQVLVFEGGWPEWREAGYP